jgi:glutamine synthetase type III
LDHGSDKTLAQVVTEVRKSLVKYIVGSMAMEEDSQDSQDDKKSTSSTSFIGGKISLNAPTSSSCLSGSFVDIDRICIVSLKSLIEEMGERINYGLALDDLANGLPEGVTEIPPVSSAVCGLTHSETYECFRVANSIISMGT